MKWLFFFLKLALFVFLFFRVAEWCDTKTDKFRILRIFSTLEHNPGWEVTPPPANRQEEIAHLLKQRYTYLSSGGQCYVFASEDGSAVIKFFKHHRRHIPAYLAALPLPKPLADRRTRRSMKKEGKLLRDFASYKLAYERLPEETGVLFVHLNKTDDLHPTLRIVDKLGIAHSLDLDRVEFVLQKRATLVYPHLKAQLEQNNLEGAKSSIRSLVDLIVERSKKGIFDEDARIHRNFGFVEGKACIIDVGRLVNDPKRKESVHYLNDLYKITTPFKEWLQHHHPQLVSTLDQEIERATNEAR